MHLLGTFPARRSLYHGCFTGLESVSQSSFLQLAMHWCIAGFGDADTIALEPIECSISTSPVKYHELVQIDEIDDLNQLCQQRDDGDQRHISKTHQFLHQVELITVTAYSVKLCFIT